jgi:hypothetical protein
MRTRVLPLGTVFVLLTTMPVQADPPVSHQADYLQLPTGVQRWHSSALRAVGGLNIHVGMLPPTAQNQTPAARWLLPQPWWGDELVNRR